MLVRGVQKIEVLKCCAYWMVSILLSIMNSDHFLFDVLCHPEVPQSP